MIYQDALSSLNPSMTIAGAAQAFTPAAPRTPEQLRELVNLTPERTLRPPHERVRRHRNAC